MDPPAKMLWLKRHEPEVYAQAWKLLDVKDWLILRATGHAATTADLANVTWMMDTRKGREGWSDALVSRFGLRRELLPDIVDGTASPGGLTDAAASELGLPAGLPVFAGAGDVCAAALGSGARLPRLRARLRFFQKLRVFLRSQSQCLALVSLGQASACSELIVQALTVLGHF